MAGRTPLACLAILAVLVAAGFFTSAASAGLICVSSYNPCGAAMELSKSGPNYSNAGDPATYTYTLTNTGTDDIADITVADDLCSPVTGPDGDDGDDGVLGVDETWTY